MALTSGTRVGSYEFLGPLGQGGMGEVYRARDTREQQSLASPQLRFVLNWVEDLKRKVPTGK